MCWPSPVRSVEAWINSRYWILLIFCLIFTQRLMPFKMDLQISVQKKKRNVIENTPEQ